MMRKLIDHPTLDFDAAVSFIQEHIEMERTKLEADKVLRNESDYLMGEYRIAHCELLLALLYRSRS